jgi:putative adhesin
MPTFDTPDTITATIDVVHGDIRITATERDTTIVKVDPTDASNEEDRKAAEQTRVEYAGRQLLVKAPKLRSWLPRGTGGSIDVTIELPAGSQVNGTAAVADFHCDGPLGDCRIKTGIGRIQVDRAGTLSLKTGIGDITVDHATGHADVTAGSGDVRLRELDASAVVKSSSGDTWVDAAGGDLRLKAANGNIAVDTSQASVGAKSANGDVRLGEVVRGSVVLETQLGDLEVGIPEGTPAWLDVRASAGRVHNALDAAEAPDPSSADTVDVRARTSAGDVVIRRP